MDKNDMKRCEGATTSTTGSIMMENNLYFIHLPGSHFFASSSILCGAAFRKGREKSLFCIISELTPGGAKSSVLHFQQFYWYFEASNSSQNGLKNLLIHVFSPPSATCIPRNIAFILCLFSLCPLRHSSLRMRKAFAKLDVHDGRKIKLNLITHSSTRTLL